MLVTLASVGQQVVAVTFLTSVDWLPLCLTLISEWPVLSTCLCCSLLPTVSSLLTSPADCPLLLLPVSFSGTFLPSSIPGLGRDFMCRPFVWVLRQNRQRDSQTGTHTHRNECHPSCHTCHTNWIWQR